MIRISAFQRPTKLVLVFLFVLLSESLASADRVFLSLQSFAQAQRLPNTVHIQSALRDVAAAVPLEP